MENGPQVDVAKALEAEVATNPVDDILNDDERIARVESRRLERFQSIYAEQQREGLAAAATQLTPFTIHFVVAVVMAMCQISYATNCYYWWIISLWSSMIMTWDEMVSIREYTVFHNLLICGHTSIHSGYIKPNQNLNRKLILGIKLFGIILTFGPTQITIYKYNHQSMCYYNVLVI